MSDQDKNQLFSSASFWTRGEGQQKDVVVSSRIRLARNLKNHSFPHKMDSREARSVVKEIAGAIKKNGNYTLVEYDKMSPAELSILVEKHLVSPQHISTPEGRALLIRNDEAVAIMINEEDHLRIQTIFPAMQIKEAWRVANKVDDQLSATLEIAFQPEFGYLASCPTNLGTGLRASVMLHLPALVITKKAQSLLSPLPRMGFALRGLYGEGSETTGNLYQISNQRTLGIREEDILDSMTDVCMRLVEEERTARKLLMENNSCSLSDYVWRACGVLKYARSLSSNELLEKLSAVRLGVGMGIINGLTQGMINQLMIESKPAFIQREHHAPLTPEQRDWERAAWVRKFVEQI